MKPLKSEMVGYSSKVIGNRLHVIARICVTYRDASTVSAHVRINHPVARRSKPLSDTGARPVGPILCNSMGRNDRFPRTGVIKEQFCVVKS